MRSDALRQRHESRMREISRQNQPVRRCDDGRRGPADA
jgi:hypothetical protein